MTLHDHELIMNVSLTNLFNGPKPNDIMILMTNHTVNVPCINVYIVWALVILLISKHKPHPKIDLAASYLDQLFQPYSER
jgi:hypothetical protein